MLDKNIFFVTSTGTEIGKTFLSVKIIEYFLKKNITIDPYKPILSGFDKKKLHKTDSGKLLIAAKKESSLINIEKITPWLFKKPLAPSISAKYENKNISYKELKNWCLNKKKLSMCNYLLFEGAGGLMVPIERKKTFINLFKDLKSPVVLVVGNYLGTISHTLSAINNLINHNIDIINVVFNEGNKIEKNYYDNLELLKSSIKSKILIRCFSNNTDLHNDQVSKIANDIVRYFKKMA